LYIVKQRRTHSRMVDWTPICRFNEDGNYLGPAVFDTKEEAQSYLEKYNDKMTQHFLRLTAIYQKLYG
jgi:hypothetical protein